MSKSIIKTITFKEVREFTDSSSFSVKFPFGDNDLLEIKDPSIEVGKLKSLTLVTNCLKHIWDFKHTELFTNVEYSKGSASDVVSTEQLKNTIKKIQLGEYNTPFSRVLSDFYNIDDKNLGFIDKTTYESIVSHSLYKWFRETYIIGTSLETFITEGKASDKSSISWEETEMSFDESKIFIEKEEEQPKVLVIFKKAKSIQDVKENVSIYKDLARDMVRGFLFRDVTGIPSEIIYRTSLREGVDITRICVAYNFADVILSKVDDSSQSIEEEELIKLIKDKRISTYKTTFTGQAGSDTLLFLKSRLADISNKMSGELANEITTIELFLKEKEALAIEIDKYKLADKDSAEAIMETEEYPLNVTKWSTALTKLYTRIFEIYSKEKKKNLKFLNFNNKVNEENIVFYFDKNRNLTGMLTTPVAKSKSSLKTTEVQSIAIPFDSVNPKYQINIPDTEAGTKVVLITDIALLSIDDTDSDIVVKSGEDEAFPRLKDHLSYVLKTTEQFDKIGDYPYHLPLVPLKSVHNLFMIGNAFLKEESLAWDTFVNKYHYPLLKIYPSGKKKETPDGAPDTFTKKVGKKDFDKSYAYKIALVPALVSKYNCYNDLLEIIDGGDTSEMLEFFFFKFPWQELLMRAALSSRDRVEALGVSSGVIGCVERFDLNKILAAYRNLKAIWDNKENILVGLVPTSPTIPFLEYVQLIDFTAELRSRFIAIIVEALLSAFESLIGFAVRDLLNMCDLDLEEINALARSRDKSDSFPKNPDPNGGGAGDPGYENKINHFNCSLMEMIKDSNIDFAILLEDLKGQTLVPSKLDICDLKKYLDSVSKALDATELRRLLSGSANANTVDLAISIAKNLMDGPITYRTGLQRFFTHLGGIVSTRKCMVAEAASLNFEIGACPEDNLLANEKGIKAREDNLLANEKGIKARIAAKGLGDDYMVDITNDALHGLEKLCRMLGNLTDDVFEISAELPSVINEFGRNTLQKSVDAPLASFGGLNDILREQSNQGFSSDPKAPGGLYALLRKIYNHDLETVNDVDEKDIFYPLLTDFNVTNITDDMNITPDGTIIFGKILSVKESGKVTLAGGVETSVELEPANVFNEKYDLAGYIIKETSTDLGIKSQDGTIYQSTFNGDQDRNLKKINFGVLVSSSEVTGLKSLDDKDEVKKFLDKLFNTSRYESYSKKFNDIISDSGKDPAREIGNLLLYKKVINDSKSCPEKVEK